MIHPIQQFQLLKPQTQHDCDYLMQILSLFCMTIREKLNSRQMHIAHQEVNFTLTIHHNSVGVLCSMALSYRFWRNVTIYTTIYNIIYKGYHHMGRSQHALPQGFQHLHLRLWESMRQPDNHGETAAGCLLNFLWLWPWPCTGQCCLQEATEIWTRWGTFFTG